VRVGKGAALGVGACVVPGRSVGDWAIVDPGSVVIRDVPPAARVSGAPARATAPPLGDTPVAPLITAGRA
jgi:acetyltransferase EpsM